ncbi:MAG TPA: lysophospholipid acyltransferase family protein [Tepidisphaeraceae bacterium]|jgi:1-acyl-sn-glycerol-3-phosphate acyltransferase|nr:lysophospholipid acyltransferase family protein [Tepidisphaeraceae bacterium]
MPIRVVAHCDTAGDVLSLHASGALTTDIKAADGSINATIPWLSIRTIRDVGWTVSSADHPVALPLHALDEDERLIGYAGADPDVLAARFPGKKMIRVELNMADPLPGPAVGWESLDGIVLDSSAAGRLSQGAVATLLACGAAIAIRSAHMPGGGWPWKRQGGYWVMHANVAGPDAAYFPEAYQPTQAWARGWPAALRRQALGAAAVFAIFITALTLWRSRWTAPAVVALCALTAAAAIRWRDHQPVDIAAGGSVIVLTDSTTQRDQWTYHAVLRSADCRVPWRSLSRPVFGYRQQAQEIGARLRCAADGEPALFSYHLQPRQSLAFVARELSPARVTLSTTMPITSPLRTLADNSYAMAGDRMSGQIFGDGEEEWPSVVIARGMPAGDLSSNGVSPSRVIAWDRPADRVENRVSVRALGWANLAFTRLYHQLTIRRPSPLPRVGPAILVCNHVSGLDPLLLQSCCKRLVIWMMAKEYYDIKPMGWIFRTVQAIPVERNGRDMGATRAALRALEKGRILGIFPEGKIETTRDLLPFQTGVALLAMKANVPVFPAYIDGTHRGKEMVEAFSKPNRVVITFGPEVEFDRSATNRQSLDQATEKIQRAVRNLTLSATK